MNDDTSPSPENSPIDGKFRATAVLAFLLSAIGMAFLFAGADFRPVGCWTLCGGLALGGVACRWDRRLEGFSFFFYVVAFILNAFFLPEIYTWTLGTFTPPKAIPFLVQITMFAMGVTLSFADFGRVLKMPLGVLIGMGLQFTLMPLGGAIFAVLFGLKPEIAVGLILIGSCPSGVTSNVVTYIAKGNVPLSVSLTVCATLAAPIMTPFWMNMLAGRYVPIETVPMVVSIFTMIIIPVLLGLLIHSFFKRLVDWIAPILPAIAMLSICLIIAITVALGRDDLMQVGLALFGASICHNAFGCTLGYWLSRLCRLSERDCRTIALEVGLQNGGMATGLALSVLKSPLAALPSAIFGPWSALTMSVLASWWRTRTPDERD